MLPIMSWTRYAVLASCSLHTMLALSSHLIVPRLAVDGGCNVPCANDEVTKMLAVITLKGVALDHRFENGKYLRLSHRFWGWRKDLREEYWDKEEESVPRYILFSRWP
jgi:hypothetical protein